MCCLHYHDAGLHVSARARRNNLSKGTSIDIPTARDSKQRTAAIWGLLKSISLKFPQASSFRSVVILLSACRESSNPIFARAQGTDKMLDPQMLPTHQSWLLLLAVSRSRRIPEVWCDTHVANLMSRVPRTALASGGSDRRMLLRCRAAAS